MEVTAVKLLTSSLNQLICKITEFIDELEAQNLLKPIYLDYYFNEFSNITYNDNGSSSHSTSPNVFAKPFWAKSIPVILQTVKATTEYEKLLNDIQMQRIKSGGIVNILNELISEIASHYLDCRVGIEDGFAKTCENLTVTFIKHLEGENVLFFVKSQLLGVVVKSKPIEISYANVTATISEFNLDDGKIVKPYGLNGIDSRLPTGLLKLEIPESHPHNIHKYIRQASTIIRLYRVGDVSSIQTQIKTESFMMNRFGIGVYSGEKRVPQWSYTLTDGDAIALKEFWLSLQNHIPDGYGHPSNLINSLEIAYQRYSDALLGIGSEEQRIASAVMGLEGLFLNDNAELKYKLRQRVAKLIGGLMLDSYSANELVGSAYDIRSAFVHGDTVSKNTKKQILKKQTSFNNVLGQLLNYLRISIVFFTLTKNSFNKDTLINLMDESNFDVKKYRQFLKICKPFRNFFK